MFLVFIQDGTNKQTTFIAYIDWCWLWGAASALRAGAFVFFDGGSLPPTATAVAMIHSDYTFVYMVFVLLVRRNTLHRPLTVLTNN